MKVEDIMIDNRICLNPMKWNEFFELIQKEYPDEKLDKPLILAGWNFSNDFEKNTRFRRHLELGIATGVAEGFFEKVSEEDWYKA